MVSLQQFLLLIAVPVLLFLSGFFSKNVRKAHNGAFQRIFIPYVVLQGCYLLLGILSQKIHITSSSLISVSLFAPSGPFYYLLVLFVLRYFIADISKIKYSLVPVTLLGLLLGLDSQLGFAGAFHAIFSLAPFFLLGFYVDNELVQKLRKIPRIIPAVLLAFVFVFCCFYSFGGHYMNSYSYYGITAATGIIHRFIFYLTSGLCIFSLVCLVPQNRCFLSVIGKNSMVVYIASTFLLPQLYPVIAPYLPFSEVPIIAILYIFIFCLMVVYIFSRNCFTRFYTIVFGKINGFLFRNE